MNGKALWIRLLAVAIMIAAVVGGTYAVPEAEIEQAVIDGVAWLAGAQDMGDGHWGGSEQAAETCFALLKLQERAHDLGFDSPFDPNYEYEQNVHLGWGYIFGVPHVHMGSISPQWHDPDWDDPDTNGNGYGLYFDSYGSHQTYATGICLMALVASGTPDRLNDGGLDFDGDMSPDTFQEIAQEVVDWLAFSQGDHSWCDGGWGYDANDNACAHADQSNSGYAVLGLAYAEDFGCTVPDWVRAELDIWMAYVQCADGGSSYNGCGSSNLLRTGNLIFEMCFNSYDQDGAPFQAALGYIDDTWRHGSNDPGWGYNVWPASYQAMYCVMKGLEYCGIELVDTDGDGDRDDDWFNQEPPAVPAEDFASVLVEQQNGDGSWPWCDWGDDILCTTWALLTLEKVTPPPPVIDVFVDIKPGSCPNPFNGKSRGVLPMAVLGTDDFDVTTIDPATIALTREGYEDGVAPLRWAYWDVATPFEGELCDCHELYGDGYQDLVLFFRTQEVKTTLGLDMEQGNTLPLTIVGNLYEDAGGTPIEGSDCVWVLK
jgi:hypothetical protein